MAERIILGYRSDINQTGLWVSAPGKSARSTTPTDLIASPDKFLNSYVQKGFISSPTLSLVSDTHSTGSTYVCDSYNGDWSNCQDYYYPGAQYHQTGADKQGNAIYKWCTFTATSCASGHTEQTANNGVGTYEYSIAHGLGYTPRAHISVQPTNPGDVVPQVFVTSSSIICRYYEAINGYVAGDHIAYWGTIDSTKSFSCNIHYALLVRSL